MSSQDYPLPGHAGITLAKAFLPNCQQGSQFAFTSLVAIGSRHGYWTGLPCLSREPNRCIGSAKALVTAPLHNFEEKTFIKRARVDLKEFAGMIAIIQNLVFCHACCDGGVDLKSALNVVLIIVWD